MFKAKNNKLLKSTSDTGEPLTPIPKRYNWYPNASLDSPLNKGLKAESPQPKTISSYGKHNLINVRKNPLTPTPKSYKGGPPQFGD